MITNTKKILDNAKKGGYAVPQFNINNLEFAKYILEEANSLNKHIILGVSEGAIKYMGGVNIVVSLIKALVQDLNITVDVAIHLDHGGSFELCKKCIDAGFTSVMIDASHLSLEENINVTKQVVDYAHKCDVTVEAEIGRIGGTEEHITSEIYYARLEDVLEIINKTNIDSIAPALGSVHGFYKGEPKLDFVTMKAIRDSIELPMVLHGGSGIPDYQIKEAISCGINKINIDTELKAAWNNAVRTFIKENPDAYDPRKIISSGEENIKKVVKEKLNLFSNI